MFIAFSSLEVLLAEYSLNDLTLLSPSGWILPFLSIRHLPAISLRAPSARTLTSLRQWDNFLADQFLLAWQVVVVIYRLCEIGK